MSSMGRRLAKRSVGIDLMLEQYHSLVHLLATWRKDHEPQQKQKGNRRNDGKVFDFVKGLRLQAQLIYRIRDVLSSTDFEIDWGQLVDKNGLACSPECDIIIHRRGYIRRWNGESDKTIMDFKFINSQDALVVISCKSFMTNVTNVDQEYSKLMKRYVEKVWLFAECCKPNAIEKLKNASKSAGYDKYWYLYSWDRNKSTIAESDKVWLDFVASLKRLSKKGK